MPRHRAMVSASSWAAASRMVSVGAVIPTRAQPGAASKAVATRVGSMFMPYENIYGTSDQGGDTESCALDQIGKPHRRSLNTAAPGQDAQVGAQNMPEKIASKWWDGRSDY